MPNNEGWALRKAERRQQNGVLRNLYSDRDEALRSAPVEKGVVVWKVNYVADFLQSAREGLGAFLKSPRFRPNHDEMFRAESDVRTKDHARVLGAR
jgi:hypothetical protein